MSNFHGECIRNAFTTIANSICITAKVKPILCFCANRISGEKRPTKWRFQWVGTNLSMFKRKSYLFSLKRAQLLCLFDLFFKIHFKVYLCSFWCIHQNDRSNRKRFVLTIFFPAVRCKIIKVQKQFVVFFLSEKCLSDEVLHVLLTVEILSMWLLIVSPKSISIYDAHKHVLYDFDSTDNCLHALDSFFSL